MYETVYIHAYTKQNNKSSVYYRSEPEAMVVNAVNQAGQDDFDMYEAEEYEDDQEEVESEAYEDDQ